MAVVELQNISKTYKRGITTPRFHAVREVSFALNPGELVGFIGPNGAGKTTTIKMIMGLAKPGKGTVRVFGKNPADAFSRRDVAYVSEQPYLYDHLTVAEMVAFVARLKGIDSGKIDGEVGRVLGIVGLAENAAGKTGQISKGMQQRLNFAQALLGDPSVFILDEPMSGMDPPGRSLLRRIITDLHTRGKTVFFSTHILEDIRQICPRVIVLSSGSLHYDGSVEFLMSKGFLGTELVFTSVPGDLLTRISALGGSVEQNDPGTVVVFVPKERDALEIQKMLAAQGFFCTSIRKRVKSLETVLYGDKAPIVNDQLSMIACSELLN